MPSRIWRRYMWRKPNQPRRRWHDDLLTQLLNNAEGAISDRAHHNLRHLNLANRFQREAARKDVRKHWAQVA